MSRHGFFIFYLQSVLSLSLIFLVKIAEGIFVSAILFVLSQTFLSSKNIHGKGGREANNFPFKLLRLYSIYFSLFSSQNSTPPPHLKIGEGGEERFQERLGE